MNPTQSPPAVALVCSAGGLHALRRVLGPLPSDFPAAIVVLQHQRPSGPSMLAPILARACRLPVRDARDGDALVAGCVLVVPPGTTGGQVFRLRGQGLPRLAGGSPGDLYVTVRLEVPAGLDARTHELVRELARLMPVETRTALDRYRGGAE